MTFEEYFSSERDYLHGGKKGPVFSLKGLRENLFSIHTTVPEHGCRRLGYVDQYARSSLSRCSKAKAMKTSRLALPWLVKNEEPEK